MSSQSLSYRDALLLGTAVAIGSAATGAAVAVATTLTLVKYSPSEKQSDPSPATATTFQSLCSYLQYVMFTGRTHFGKSCSVRVDTADGKANNRAVQADEGKNKPLSAETGKTCVGSDFCSLSHAENEESSGELELAPSRLCRMFDSVHTSTPITGERTELLPAATTASTTACQSEWSMDVEVTPLSKNCSYIGLTDACFKDVGGVQVAEVPSSGSQGSPDCWDEKQTCGETDGIVVSSTILHKPSPLSKALVNGKRIDPADPRKREDYLSWDDYFMAIAFLSAKRSKDPNRQVGACIVGQDKVILGIGYNGFPRNISDDDLPWAKVAEDNDPLLTKYPYVCHAEVNAVLNKNNATVSGQRLYVTLYPCNECAKIIIQSGIAEVVYYQDKGCHHGEGSAAPDPIYAASRRLLSLAGVKVWQHQPKRTITIDYN